MMKHGPIKDALCVLFFFILWHAIIWDITYSRAYKRGYIDAANGQPGYDLVTHDDGSRTWERSDTLKGYHETEEEGE